MAKVKPTQEMARADRVKPKAFTHLTKDGREIPDPTPMDPPVGYIKQPSISDRIREMIRSEKLRAEAEQAGQETFEEADDFDVGDDFDPTVMFEDVFDGLPPSKEPPLPAQIADAVAAGIERAFAPADSEEKKEPGAGPVAREPERAAPRAEASSGTPGPEPTPPAGPRGPGRFFTK